MTTTAPDTFTTTCGRTITSDQHHYIDAPFGKPTVMLDRDLVLAYATAQYFNAEAGPLTSGDIEQAVEDLLDIRDEDYTHFATICDMLGFPCPIIEPRRIAR